MVSPHERVTGEAPGTGDFALRNALTHPRRAFMITKGLVPEAGTRPFTIMEMSLRYWACEAAAANGNSSAILWREPGHKHGTAAGTRASWRGGSGAWRAAPRRS